MSTTVVADAADGADGVTGLIFTYGRYPDCPRSGSPLAAENNLNPECAEEGLCPAAGQRVREGFLASQIGSKPREVLSGMWLGFARRDLQQLEAI